MHSDHQIFPQKPVAGPIANQWGGCNLPDAAAIASVFGGTVLPLGVPHTTPFLGVEFQPSEVCPKNFIIVDKTYIRSQIMFHPAVAPKLCYPGLNIHSSNIQYNVERTYPHNEEREITVLNEDSDDIDALLSSEDDEEREFDEEEVSTARTRGNYENDISDSGSSYGSKPRKNSGLSSLNKSFSSGKSCDSERKRQKIRKMVKALSGIVPSGNNQMNTVAVLDEAVRYLKSLKVEVQKIGVRNLKN